MKSKPLIFGADLGTLRNDQNPAIRQICNISAGAKEKMTFRRAIVANLLSPRALVQSVKALKPKAGTQSASNAQKLERTLRNDKKKPTQRELNSARLNATYRKPSF